MAKEKNVTEQTETDKKLIEVAIDLFSTAGFKGTSIRDIAKATGMTISNIYYYFGNKDGLLLAILDHSSKHLVDRLREAAQADLEPVERFKHLVATHLNLVKYHKREAKIFFLDEERLSPEGNRINKGFQTEILNLYRDELRTLRGMGHVRYDHLTVLALNVLGVINWHLKWYRPDGPLSLDALVDEILSFIFSGVFGTPATFDPPPSDSPPA